MMLPSVPFFLPLEFSFSYLLLFASPRSFSLSSVPPLFLFPFHLSLSLSPSILIEEPEPEPPYLPFPRVFLCFSWRYPLLQAPSLGHLFYLFINILSILGFYFSLRERAHERDRERKLTTSSTYLIHPHHISLTLRSAFPLPPFNRRTAHTR